MAVLHALCCRADFTVSGDSKGHSPPNGQPADTGYYGTSAEEDLRGIKQEYTRKKILFAAAAIGDDKPSIERIYGDSFLDITDLNQLPIKLTTLVKRHIRV